MRPKVAKPLMNSKLSLKIFEHVLDSKKQVLDISDHATYDEMTEYYKFPGV